VIISTIHYEDVGRHDKPLPPSMGHGARFVLLKVILWVQ